MKISKMRIVIDVNKTGEDYTISVGSRYPGEEPPDDEKDQDILLGLMMTLVAVLRSYGEMGDEIRADLRALCDVAARQGEDIGGEDLLNMFYRKRDVN